MIKNQTFIGIQALRFFAAMLVVVTHATSMVGERMYLLPGEHYWRPGMAGVDMFFIISGFVMAVSARSIRDRVNAWKLFLMRRVIRVVPMYWLATTFKLTFIMIFPAMALNTPVEFWHVVASYFFVPTFDSTGNMILPVLKVGWTLIYEMTFYLLFAAALFLRWPPLLSTAIIFGIFTLINMFSEPSSPLGFGFLNPIMLEFVMGMMVAKYCTQIKLTRLVLPVVLVPFCLAIMIWGGSLDIWWRWLYWGAPSMVIVALFVMTEAQLRVHMPKVFIVLGDSSYSLYLTHTLLIPIIGSILVKLNMINGTVAVISCLIAAPIAGLIVYLTIERHITEFLKKFIKSPRHEVMVGSNP